MPNLPNPVPFHTHPHSIDSASTPQSFIDREVELGTGHAAATDHGSLAAVKQMFDLARAVSRGLPESDRVLREITRTEALSDANDERWASGLPKVYSLHPNFKSTLRDEAVRHDLHELHALASSLSTDAGKLVFKDPSGVVHNLY